MWVSRVPAARRVIAALGSTGGQGTWSMAVRSATSSAYKEPVMVPRGGRWLVLEPLTNKGTGFEMEERDRLGLRGLVPPRTLTLEEQVEKIISSVRAEEDPLEKHKQLSALQDRNETLFFRVLTDYLEELAPYVYTPTVGRVCQLFGTNFRRPRGMYFTTSDRGQMSSMVYNWPIDDVQIIVVTDGSRILGLGDLGANGMGIPIGKLALYCAAGGISPSRVLPVMLDCGTDNIKLIRDPHYLGMPHRRLKGESYYSLVEEFMRACRLRWPRALVQFEDFSSDKAATILEDYRNDFLCFNDDIQGTGATTLAGALAAFRVQGIPLKEQRIVVLGAGSAGLGVATSLWQGMIADGLTAEEARRRFWIVDNLGLIGERQGLTDGQRAFARHDMANGISLLDVVKTVRPTMLLGLTGVGGLFTEDIIREMGKHVDRPIVFPLSNPTDRAECSARQAIEWTDGRAIFASGSPFDPFEFHGRVFHPSQCNNMFIFPGVGLGATVVDAAHVTDSMFAAAARELAECLSPEDIKAGRVFPRVSAIRDVSARIATVVAKTAIQEGIADTIPTGDLGAFIRSKMWSPVYRPLVTVHRRAK